MNSTTESILNEDNEISLHKLCYKLDDEQAEAVMIENKNVLVKANAGAGKTKVLTSRVAYLLASGVLESEIILLTFTNKAGKEMLERVQLMLNGRKLSILGGTFHHVAVVFLRKYANLLGYKKNFTIFDTDDAKALITTIRKDYLKKHNIKPKDFPESKVIYHYGSSSINRNLSIEHINEEENNFSSTDIEGIIEILSEYKRRKKESNVMDFDDLLVNLASLVMNPSVRQELNQRYRYLLVDEFQDINHLQAIIIKQLNRGNNNLFVVGDINQGIYSWRGSDSRFIKDFRMDFISAESLYITHNYRSDAKILELAEASINNNYLYSHEKTVIKPHLPGVHIPTVSKCVDDFQQSEYIVKTIKQYVRKGKELKDMAILLRTNYLTRIIESTLRKNNIPYKLLAGLSFFERKHIKDIVAFLKFIENPKDEVAFARMAGLFEGLGQKTIEKLFETYKMYDYEIQALYGANVNKRATDGLESMCRVLETILTPELTVSMMIKGIVNQYYGNYLQNREIDYLERMVEIDYLISTANSYKSLSDFLSEMILDEVENEENTDNVITISTIHKSKGLEWDCVFIPYLNTGIFPSAKSFNSESDMEESRRLFYVAVTRAKQHLHMSYVQWFGAEHKSLYPSVFIDELPPNLYNFIK